MRSRILYRTDDGRIDGPRGAIKKTAVGVGQGWAVAGVALADEVGTQLFVRRETTPSGG